MNYLYVLNIWQGEVGEGSKITPFQLVQRFATSSILLVVQYHRDCGLKRFTAHGIVAGVAGDQNRQFVLIVSNGIDGCACLLID